MDGLFKATSLLLAAFLSLPSGSVIAMQPVTTLPGSNVPEISFEELGGAEEQNPIPSGSVLNEESPLSAAEALDDVSKISSPPSAIYARGYNENARPDLPGYGTVLTHDGSNFSYRYDLGAGSGAALDVVLESSEGSFSLPEVFRFGLSRKNANPSFDGLGHILVTLEDVNGELKVLSISNMTDSLLPFHMDLSGPPFDASQVKKITFTQKHADIDPTLMSVHRRGEIFIQIEGIGNRNPINGSVPVPEPENPQADLKSTVKQFIRGEGSVEGFLTLQPVVNETHSFLYDVGGSKGATALLQYKAQDDEPLALNPVVKLSMKNSGNGADIRVRFLDETMKEAIFVLNLTDTLQVFELDLMNADFAASAFDPTKVMSFEIEIDRSLSPERKGEIMVQFTDLLPENDAQTIENLKPSITVVEPEGNGVFTANISGLEGAEVFQFQVASDANFTDVVFEGFPRPFFYESEVLDPDVFAYFNVATPGTYYLRARGSANERVEVGPLSMWSETFEYEVTNVVDPGNYATLKPVITDLRSHLFHAEITFDFPADVDRDTKFYHIQLATDPDFTNILQEDFPAFGPAHVGWPENGKYYVRIRGAHSGSMFEGFVSDWSETAIFNIDSGFATSGPQFTNATVDENRQMDLSFTTVPGAALYHIQVLGSGSFENVIHDFKSTDTSFNLDLSSFIGSYQVRVSASKSNPFQEGPVTTWSVINLPDPLPGVFVLSPMSGLNVGDINLFGQADPQIIYPTTITPDTAQVELFTSRTGSYAKMTNGLEQFTGVGFSFDDFSTDPFETVDISGLSEWIFGIKANGAGALKMEIIDDEDNKHAIQLNPLTEGEFKYFKLPISGIKGIDLTKVRLVYFIFEGAAGAEATLDVQIGKDFRPGAGIYEDTSKTHEDLDGDDLGIEGIGFLQALAPGGDASSEVVGNDTGFTINYDTGTQGWAGGGLNFDDPNTGEVESIDFSSVERILAGLTSRTARVKVEVIDTSGARSILYVNGLHESNQKIFEVQTPLLDNIDLTSIASLYFIIEGNNEAGAFNIQFVPNVPS